MCFVDNIHAQNHNKNHQISLSAGQMIIFKDSIIYANNDTTVNIPYDEDYIIRKNRPSKSDSFYIDLKKRAYKRKWTRELHDIILISKSTDKAKPESQKTHLGVLYFLSYQDKYIRNIYIKKLDVFGPSINNPYGQPSTVLGEVGNKIHIKTRDRVIKNNLLIKSGDKIDPYVLADNERIIRQLPFIEDVKFNVINDTIISDYVDIEIILKDNFSKGFDVSTSNLKSLYIDTWDNNIVGTGQELDHMYFVDYENKPSEGLKGYYNTKNIYGSFINGRVEYEAIGNQGYSFRLWRDFYTQRTKYAGEIRYDNYNKDYSRVKLDSITEFFPLSYENKSAWIGRAFPINWRSFTSLTNFSLSVGYYEKKFTNRPLVTSSTRYKYWNEKCFLTSYSFSTIGYFKSSLVYNYGRTEDIPYGFVLTFTHGIEKNEFNDRIYNNVSFIKGDKIGQLGFGYVYSSLGGFINKNRFEQGMLKIGLKYFSNLLVIGKYKNRFFVNIEFTKGYHRLADEYLDINNFSGVRGFSNDSAIGTQRLVINTENVLFTPFYFAGFRFAFFAFADFAYIGSTYDWIFKNTLYPGFGVGVRLRNEHLVFKKFQIRFAYYPWMTERASGDLFALTSEWRFHPLDMNIKSPQIVEFK